MAYRRMALILVLATAIGALVLAQTDSPSFDVASIHENRSGSDEGSLGPTAGGYEAQNIPLRLLVVRAFDVRAFQVVGGPGWIDATRFDVVGRAGANSTPQQVRLMLRQLLADRFKLRVHTEMRDLPVYNLTLARPDGTTGPQLKPSTAACGDGPTGPRNPCGMSGSFGTARGALEAIGQPLDRLAAQLSTAVDRIVINKTGLPGRFDFHIAWSSGGFNAADAARPDDAPSVFTAVQEQLGLKLEGSRGPVEVIVIDSADRLTEN
jgi:uncharacterized protein (TIGR03435 family)